MVNVSGSIKLVTNQPANISEVWLRAPQGRINGTGYVAELPGSYEVNNGQVSFEVLPGAALMVIVSQSRPVGTVKLIVPDKENATLRECIEAAGLISDGTLDALESLASDVAADLARVMDARADAEAARDDAVSAAGEAAGEVRDEFSGMLDDAQTAAINATDAARTEVARVVDGAPEDLDTIREVAEYAQDNRDITDQLNQAIGNKANKGHTHTTSEVTGLDDALDGKADVSHTHAPEDVTGLEGELQSLRDLIHARHAFFSGEGAPTNLPYAVVGDYYFDESTEELHKITGV